MKTYINIIRRAVARITAKYKVTVLMGCPARGYVAVVHYGRSFADALDWARQYPYSDKVVIREMFMGRAALVPCAVR